MEMRVKELSPLSAVEGAADAVSAALTDAMIERLATTAATGLEIVDRLNDPDTRAAVHRLIDGLTSMHATGALDTVFEAAEIMQAARSAATDDMIERLYHFVEVMVNNLATREIAELARDAEMSLYEAAKRVKEPETPKSMMGLVRTMMQPESVQTLSLLLAFGTALRKRTQGGNGAAKPHFTVPV